MAKLADNYGKAHGALQVPAVEFLKITYPSFDLLKTIEATGPGHSRPIVLLGARGNRI